VSEFRLTPEDAAPPEKRRRTCDWELPPQSGLRPLRVCYVPLVGECICAFGPRPQRGVQESPFVARVSPPERGSRYSRSLDWLGEWHTCDAIGQGKASGYEGAVVVPVDELRDADLLEIRAGTYATGQTRKAYLWQPEVGLEELSSLELRAALRSPWRRWVQTGALDARGRAIALREREP
jgi:hypothetical protein